MSKEKIQICEDLADIMPPEYQELVATATFGNQDRGWKDIGSSKELIEQHSLCAGCPESIAFRYILASLPAPEDTVFVGSTGCTSLVFPHVAVHNIHSLFGNQNAIASGLKRTLASRFPDVEKDVVVLAGDGATVDIGLDMTMQSWFRLEKFTTICFNNDQAIFLDSGVKRSRITFLHGNNLSVKHHDDIWEYQFTPVIDTLSSYSAIAFGGCHAFFSAKKRIRNRKFTISIGSHSQKMRGCNCPLPSQTGNPDIHPSHNINTPIS